MMTFKKMNEVTGTIDSHRDKTQRKTKDVNTRHGDAVGQSFPLTEVNPNHCYGWCVAESKAKA